MTGEPPPHERLARQLVEGGVGGVLGENHELTLRMRCLSAETLYFDDGATLDDLREAVTTLEDVVRISRRVLGGSHPVTTEVENDLQKAQAALYARGLP
jgi:hypothetical protein